MPMKPITVKANFQLDTSAARQQLQGLYKELNTLTKTSSSQLGVTQQITEAVKAAELLKQTLIQATNVNTGTLDLGRFTASMKENMTSIEQFKSSLQSLGPAGEKAFNSLAMNIASAQVPLQRSSQLLGQFKTAFSNAMKWQISSMAIHKVTQEISKAFNYAQSLDKSLNRIQIVTGHSADYMKNFAVQANEAAKALNASTLEYTNAALIYYQQGLSDKEVTKRAETTLKLAKVTGESATKISQEMTAIWNNFSNGVDNLERYADVMTALGATTASSSAEIAKGLEKFAGISKTIGLSYDYAASALATVTAQTRQSADSVGTAFKTLFSRLESLNLGETLDDGVTLNKYSEALMKVGVNVLDVNGQLKNMDTILDELGSHWDKLNNAQQVALAQTVGGVRNYTSLITLMDNWEKFQTNVTTSQLAEGTLQKQADIYAQSWEAAQQRVQTAAQGIYDSLISSDFFKGLNNVTAFALNSIGGLSKALGTGGSIAGISMLINSMYKENLSTGINNLGNNILANTAYGQNQAMQVKNQMLAELTKDLSYSDSNLEKFRTAILDESKNTAKDFLKTSKELPTRASQQTYANLFAQNNAEGIQALNRLADIDRFKTVDSEILRARTTENMIGLSRAGHVLTRDIAESILTQIDMTASSSAFEKSFRAKFEDSILQATSPKANPQFIKNLQDQVNSFLVANRGMNAEDYLALLGTNNQSAIGQVISSIMSGNISKDIYTTLMGAIFEEKQISTEELDQTIQTVVRDQMKLDLNSDEGKEMVKSLTAATTGYRDAVERGYGEEYLARAQAQSVLDKYGYLKGTAINMATQSKGLLSVKQHYKLDENGQVKLNAEGKPILVDNEMTMGAFSMQTAQMMNSIAMATNSISNFGKAINSGEVTFGNFAATIGSTGLAIGQTLNFMQNNSALIGFMGGATGQKIAGKLGKIPGIGNAFQTVDTEGNVTGLSTLGGGAIATGIMAALYFGIKGYQLYKANNIDAKMSKANEDKIQMTSLAKEDKTRYESFLEVSKNQNESVNKLLGLQQGTASYTSQLISANEQARDMIDTYGLKAGTDYSIMQNGAINFSAEQIANINDRLLDQSKESSLLAQLSTSRLTQLEAVKNNAYGLRNVSRTQVAGGESRLTGSQFAITPVEITEMTDEEYEAAIKQAKQDQIENSAIARADYQQSLQSIVAFTEGVTDAQKLAVDMLGMDAKKAEEYSKGIYELSKAGGVTRKLNGEYLSESELREIYAREEYFGEAAAADMTQQQLAAAIESKGAENLLWNQIKDIAPNLDASELKTYSNYAQMSATALNALINRTSSMGGENAEAYRSLNNLALSKQAESIDNLAQALQANTSFQEMNYLQTANELLEQRHLSIDQMNTLSNYINNFGVSFGDNTGKYIYEALTSTTTGLNNELLTFLQKNNFNSSISGLASLERAIGLDANSGLNASLTQLRDTILMDVRDRGGLAQALFNSSDFQSVFESLENVFQTTGDITAQNVMDLAKKNEIIGNYLSLNGNNAAAIADMAQMVASGQLSISELTPAIENFVNQVSSAEGATQAALSYLNIQDYSDSLSTLDKWAQNIGKVFYTGKTNDMLYDAPVREALKDLLSPEDWKTFNDIIYENSFGGSTSNILSEMESKIPDAYKLLLTLGGRGKKKAGKGGGGMDDVYKYIADQANFQDWGIIVDDQGRFSFDKTKVSKEGPTKFREAWDKYWASQGQENVEFTFDTLQKYIEAIFSDKGWSQEKVTQWTTMMMGKMSASSMGAAFEAAGAVQATKDLFKEQSGSEDEILSNALTIDQLKTVFDKYEDAFSHLVFDLDENGNKILREATKEEVEKGNAGISRSDYIAYVAAEARKNGTALIGLSDNYGINGLTTAEGIGNEIRRNSYGTIIGKGISGLIEAAVKSGVDVYEDSYGGRFSTGKSLDFEQLQKFYTDTLGLSQEVFESNLQDILDSGTQLSYKYKDIFGDTHTISSRGITAAEFQQQIQTQSEEDQVREMMEQKWLNDALAGGATYIDENGKKIEVDPNNIHQVNEYRRYMREQSKHTTASDYSAQKISQDQANAYVEAKSQDQLAKEVDQYLTPENQQYLNTIVQEAISNGTEGLNILEEAAQAQGWGDTFSAFKDSLTSLFGENLDFGNLNAEGIKNITVGSMLADLPNSTAYNTLQQVGWVNGNALSRGAMINAAYDKLIIGENGQVDTSQLTPFEKQMLVAVGEINETTGGMYELSQDQAEGETAAERAKARGANLEEGELLDENGNPIELPNTSPTPNGNGGNQGGPGTPKTGGDNGKGKPTFVFDGKYFDDAGNEYAPTGDGGWLPVLKDLPENPSGDNSAVACFAAGTQILMADGTSKNIENIKIGEIIISYDEELRKFIPKKVIKFDAHYNTPIMVELKFNNGNNLILTPSHPLYTTNGWKSLDIKGALQAHGVITTLLHIGDIILGKEKEAIITNIQYLNNTTTYKSYNIDIEDCHTYLANGFIAHNKAASGQNNHLLAFAKGKTGHIAVTGELGPELRIKEDGSADLLGKRGREYTWVEPTDKIYTATQTAGILGNNSIPALEGLARGISNYIPGYFSADIASSLTTDEGGSSSNGKGRGGSGGGGKEDKDDRYDPNTLKLRDVVERYYTILQKIDDITRAVERFSKVADRAWGKDHIKAIEKQTELYKQQYDAQKKYVQEIGEYLNTDEAALTTMISEFVEGYNKDRKDVDKLTWEGAEFDENGVLTNYRDFVESLVAQYNEKADANAKDKKAQYKFQEQLKDIQFYTDTLNTYESETDKLIDLANQIIDSSLKEITYRVEYELELNNDLERVLNFKTDLVKDNVFRTAEYLALLNEEMQVTADNLSTIQQGVYDYLGTLAGENLRNGKEYTLSDLGIATRGEIAISEKDLDYNAITEKLDQWIDNLSATDEKTAKKIKKAIKRNKDTNVIENYLEIFEKLKDAGLDYTDKDLGLIELGDIKIDYDEIDFEKVTENLEEWLEVLREKDAEAATQVDEIIKRGENGLIENYREVFDKINAMNQRLSLNSIELLKTNVQEFFNQLSSIQDNPAWSGLTTEQKNQLTNYMEQTITELNKLRDQFQETIESLGDSLKDMNKKIGSEIDEFSYYGDVYNNFLGILNLTNRHMSDISSELFKNLNNKIFDNNINKIKATNTNLKLATDNLAEVNAQYENMINMRNKAMSEGNFQAADFYQDQADLLKEQLDIANNAYEDAMKDFQQAWKDALEGAKTAYEDAVKEASKVFEDSFSPFFHTLELLEAQYAREKALGDLYVDDYQRIHDLSKLNRDIENSILDTDNLKSKERLRDLQKEINDLQDSGVELSEYDLDILDKKYKLELARQALEDARDAKSLVRLTRDNNGNWGYVYTSNEDDVAEAEQNYEDAIREMEEANENYIENLQDQIISVQKEAQQAIQALSPDDFGTWDEYMAAIQAITGNANQTLAFLANQMNNALGNNDYLAPFIEDRYGVNDHNLTTDYADTPLAKLLGVTSLGQMTDDAYNRLMGLGDEAGKAWTTFQENQEQIFQAADHDIAHIGQQFTQEMQTVAQTSEEQVENVEELADRIRTTFADTAGQVMVITDEWADAVKDLTDEYSLLLEVITELKRIDGEYVEPTKMINADDAIDTWKEISDFKKNLAENGVMSLITTGENGLEYGDTYIAGSKAANDFIKNAMEAAATKESIDVSEKITEDQKKKVDNYLKQRGLVAVKWKDEIKIFYTQEEWDEFYNAHKAPKKSGGGGGYIGDPRYNSDGTPIVFSGIWYDKLFGDTGMYTGRWSADSGGYTGEWPMGSVRSNGRWALLHQKELVLNAHDTENFLNAMEIVRQLDNLTNWMANGLGDLFVPSVNGESGELEQNVHIDASFPNVTDHNEIEMAFDNLVNRASQYANRK